MTKYVVTKSVLNNETAHSLCFSIETAIEDVKKFFPAYPTCTWRIYELKEVPIIAEHVPAHTKVELVK